MQNNDKTSTCHKRCWKTGYYQYKKKNCSPQYFYTSYILFLNEVIILPISVRLTSELAAEVTIITRVLYYLVFFISLFCYCRDMNYRKVLIHLYGQYKTVRTISLVCLVLSKSLLFKRILILLQNSMYGIMECLQLCQKSTS